MKRKKLDNFFPVIIYHRITYEKINDNYSIPLFIFKEQIEYLKDMNFNTITPEDLFSSNKNEQKNVIISFDDGYESNYTIAFPIMKEYGFKGVCFITTNYIGKEGYMSWEQILELKKYGFSIQSHTHTHPFLSCLSIEEVEKELLLSKKYIEDFINTEVNSLSLPGGCSNKKVLECAFKIGYSFIFTSKPGINKINNKQKIFNRFNITQKTTLEDFKKIVKYDKSFYLRQQIRYSLLNIFKNVIGQKNYYSIWRKFAK